VGLEFFESFVEEKWLIVRFVADSDSGSSSGSDSDAADNAQS
jgi:hypothetical protein